MHASRRSPAPLRRLRVLVVVNGLLAAAPAACWCPADDHLGQLLHPRFGHTHASDHAADAFGQSEEAETVAMDGAPAWSSAAGFGPSTWQAGVQALLPLPPAMHLALGAAGLTLDAARPAEHIPAPTFPPPR